MTIAPSTYYEHKAREANPEQQPARVRRDNVLEVEVQRIWEENFRVYGVRKVQRQLNREGNRVARCTVERLTQKLGIQGVVRGRHCLTMIADDAADRCKDLVQRAFVATRPNQPRVADTTFVATWHGRVYVAFVIDMFARRIVGWWVWNSLRTDLVMDALQQALYAQTGTEGHSSQRQRVPVHSLHRAAG